MLNKIITFILFSALINSIGQASEVPNLLSDVTNKDIPLKEYHLEPQNSATGQDVKQYEHIQKLTKLLIHQQNQCVCLEGSCSFCINCIGTIGGISLTVGSALFTAFDPSPLSYTFLGGSILLTTGSFCNWFMYGTQLLKSYLHQRALKRYMASLKE
jgi:hypothetical protein